MDYRYRKSCMWYISHFFWLIILPFLVALLFDLNYILVPIFIACYILCFRITIILFAFCFRRIIPLRLAPYLWIVFHLFVVSVLIFISVNLFGINVYRTNSTNEVQSTTTTRSSYSTNTPTKTPKPTSSPTKSTVYVTIPAANYKSTPTSTPTAKPSLRGYSYYKQNYPMTFAYIVMYSNNPMTYFMIYDSYWGDLQDAHGDGIIFRTLTPYEQSLVHYPKIGEYIYISDGGSTYHSTPYCYSLLRSSVIKTSSLRRYFYVPCSKCVGD